MLFNRFISGPPKSKGLIITGQKMTASFRNRGNFNLASALPTRIAAIETSNSNTLVIGKSRSFKSAGIVLPTIISNLDSGFIVFSPASALYTAVTSGHYIGCENIKPLISECRFGRYHFPSNPLEILKDLLSTRSDIDTNLLVIDTLTLLFRPSSYHADSCRNTLHTITSELLSIINNNSGNEIIYSIINLLDQRLMTSDNEEAEMFRHMLAMAREFTLLPFFSESSYSNSKLTVADIASKRDSQIFITCQPENEITARIEQALILLYALVEPEMNTPPVLIANITQFAPERTFCEIFSKWFSKMPLRVLLTADIDTLRLKERENSLRILVDTFPEIILTSPSDQSFCTYFTKEQNEQIRTIVKNNSRTLLSTESLNISIRNDQIKPIRKILPFSDPRFAVKEKIRREKEDVRRLR